jgi:hypothetical protein
MSPKQQTENAALVKAASTAVEKSSEAFRNYLDGLGLPFDDVLVVPEERRKVFSNAPGLVALLDSTQRARAMYLSKFIAACGAGLFDAALNFIWDEVVVRLRDRVVRFDLAYFYDTAVPTAERQDYETEDDLRALSDAALIRGALKCGMLTDVGYKHLDYIREMRNWASAAHPNHASLTGFQLIAWFETCLKEVILREPAGEVLEVGRLLRNLREQTIAPGDFPAIGASVDRLPAPLAAALLRSIVGLYCDPRQDVRVRTNIRLVAKRVWDNASESSRGEIGLKYANFAANADVDRKRLAHEFLDMVGGLTYLTEPELALAIQEKVGRLEMAHEALNNFYNEPPIARELKKFIPATGKVPSQVNDEYVRVLVRCRVGRFAGVARSATPIYDELIDLFEESQIRATILAFESTEIASRLSDQGCVSRFQAIIAKLRPKAVSQPLQRVLAAIAAASSAQLPTLSADANYRRLVKAI